LGSQVPPPHLVKCLTDEVSQSQKVPRETDSCWMAWLLGVHIPSEEAEHSEEGLTDNKDSFPAAGRFQWESNTSTYWLDKVSVKFCFHFFLSSLKFVS